MGQEDKGVWNSTPAFTEGACKESEKEQPVTEDERQQLRTCGSRRVWHTRANTSERSAEARQTDFMGFGDCRSLVTFDNKQFQQG